MSIPIVAQGCMGRPGCISCSLGCTGWYLLHMVHTFTMFLMLWFIPGQKIDSLANRLQFVFSWWHVYNILKTECFSASGTTILSPLRINLPSRMRLYLKVQYSKSVVRYCFLYYGHPMYIVSFNRFIVGSAINAAFTCSVFIISMFVIMKLMLCHCGIPFLFSVKHTLDRASATGVVFLGLYLTWMSNTRHFSMNHWNLDKVADWFFSKICSSGLFLLLTFTPVGNIQIFVGRMWLPGSLFWC